MDDLIFVRTTLEEIYASYDMLRKARGMSADADLYSKFRTSKIAIERMIDPTITDERAMLSDVKRVEVDKLRINAFLLLLRGIGGSFAFTHDEMEAMRGYAIELTMKQDGYRFQLVRKQ